MTTRCFLIQALKALGITAILLVIAFIVADEWRRQTEELNLAIHIAFQLLGAVLCLTSILSLIGSFKQGELLQVRLCCHLPVLAAGLLILRPSWGTGIGFGLVASAAIIACAWRKEKP